MYPAFNNVPFLHPKVPSKPSNASCSTKMCSTRVEKQGRSCTIAIFFSEDIVATCSSWSWDCGCLVVSSYLMLTQLTLESRKWFCGMIMSRPWHGVPPVATVQQRAARGLIQARTLVSQLFHNISLGNTNSNKSINRVTIMSAWRATCDNDEL